MVSRGMVSLDRVRTGFRAARRLWRISRGSAPISASSPVRPTASAIHSVGGRLAREAQPMRSAW
eukprot:4568149-Pleurochrysis_carterae.AAC.1